MQQSFISTWRSNLSPSHCTHLPSPDQGHLLIVKYLITTVYSVPVYSDNGNETAYTHTVQGTLAYIYTPHYAHIIIAPHTGDSSYYHLHGPPPLSIILLLYNTYLPSTTGFSKEDTHWPWCLPWHYMRIVPLEKEGVVEEDEFLALRFTFCH